MYNICDSFVLILKVILKAWSDSIKQTNIPTHSKIDYSKQKYF